jgi:hypothetical protein
MNLISLTMLAAMWCAGFSLRDMTLSSDEELIMRAVEWRDTVQMEPQGTDDFTLRGARVFEVFAREPAGEAPVGLRIRMLSCSTFMEAEKATHAAVCSVQAGGWKTALPGADECYGFSDALLVRKGRVVFLVENGRKDSPEYGRGAVAAKILDAMRRSGIE